ncbi:hypothetical protein BJ684DRAFT_14700 [Piptocephalis cylindrospora]|uniref:Uncharacterized protein n=1 Tax=Piptocephalis cylindrospora TaxID=1907219 RepID=A0A4P9YAC3_9FUNG|nr:hypothetical protein BJ684DRAFT_14700 [Piptocephalis cylindrospora]|eukprot:RKP15020.1 hypothetical protein BJ684DRAFT_14700 [Piptocephalis cylindrospora]
MAKKETLKDNEDLATRLTVSAHMARQLVSSWLPPVTNSEQEGSAAQVTTSETGGDALESRPPRLGLGAKFLSHRAAMQHGLGKSEPLRRKLTGQDGGKKAVLSQSDQALSEEEEEEEEESRTRHASKTSSSAPSSTSSKSTLNAYLSKSRPGQSSGITKNKNKKKKKKGKGNAPSESGPPHKS